MSNINDLNAREWGRMEGRQDAFDARLDALDKKIDERSDKIEKKLDDLHESLYNTKVDVAQMMAQYANKDWRLTRIPHMGYFGLGLLISGGVAYAKMRFPWLASIIGL